MKFIHYIIFLLFVTILAACPDIEPIPDVPQIKFESFTLSEKVKESGSVLTGELIFSFQDGDGDIGLPEPDTINPVDTSDFDLFFIMFKKTDGEYFEIGEDEMEGHLYYRIPYIEPREGQNKSLRGDIKVEFEYLIINFDTIRYDFYLFDRARHRSNTGSTTDISFTEWKDKQ